MYVNAKGLELKTTSIGSYAVLNAGNGLRLGSNSADIFNSLANSSLKGGLGDDVYNLWDNTSKIVENAGEGNDTAYMKAWFGYQLPDNIENLVLASPGATWGTGNAQDNLIIAGAVRATLDGGLGDDVLVGGAGADVFKINAGAGSDVIYNFKPGWDIVDLKGYTFTSFDQLKAASTQSGGDVIVKLSATESLTLRDVQLSELGAYDFNLPMARAAVPAGTLQYTAGKALNANGWYVLTNKWGVGSMVEGKDYTLDSAFRSSDMTKGTTFYWSFPAVTDLYQTIKAYPEVIYGQSPYNSVLNKTENKTGLPIKVSDLVDLTATHDVSWDGTVSGFDVAYDIWFSSTPDGDKSTITTELMIWVHKGDFEPYGSLVGTYNDGTFSAKIYHKGTYTAVVADGDTPVAAIDVKGIVDKLQSMGIMSPNEYLRSIELGAEAVSGSGSLTINDLNLQIASRTASGGTIVKTVTGATQTVVETAAGVAPTLTQGAVESHKINAFGLVYQTDSKVTFADRVVTSHFTSTGAFLGAEKVKVAGGVTTTEKYDAAWKLIGTDSASGNADGSTMIRHFDAAGALQTHELIYQGGWYTTSYVFDAGMRLDHIEVANIESTGATKTISYTPTYQLISTNYQGTGNSDWIQSSGGESHIHGGLGSDVLYGGSGVDYFHLDTTIGQGDTDLINSFQVSQDKIVLDHDVFTTLKAGALDPSAFVDGAAAQDAGDRILYDRYSGSVWYDDDGNGAHAPILLAKVSADGLLTAANFTVS